MSGDSKNSGSISTNTKPIGSSPAVDIIAAHVEQYYPVPNANATAVQPVVKTVDYTVKAGNYTLTMPSVNGSYPTVFEQKHFPVGLNMIPENK